MSFTEDVYREVKKIPSGQVKTYQEVAQAINRPQAARAVASALRKNYDTSIPCHRVIRSDGKLGGYNRGGEGVKLKILKSEGYNVSVYEV